MHRQFSLQPFSRHYSHSTNPFLDFLEIDSPIGGTNQPPTISVTPSKRDHLLEVLTAYKAVQKAGTLLTLSFVTVNDYLWLLRAVSKELSVLGRNSMYYLAAAVSDFFLPRQKLVSIQLFEVFFLLMSCSKSEHKIQSGKGSLHIEMDQVPKILKPMVDEWSREGFIVSFKVNKRDSAPSVYLTVFLILDGIARDRSCIINPESSSSAGSIRTSSGYSERSSYQEIPGRVRLEGQRQFSTL
jgi:phosphopantothenate---cysteine ligase (ATP)